MEFSSAKLTLKLCTYRTRASSVRDLYIVSRALIMLLFHVKDKKKTQTFYQNKQGATYITERPEEERLRYVSLHIILNAVVE